MSKEIYISSTPHETRLAIVEKDELTEMYYERENEYTLAGSIYNGKVTRVLPGMQSSFVDIGLERDAFLYITDFMEEAGESADFEGEGGGGSRRRREGGSAEGTSREAGSREGGSGEGRRRDRDRSRGRRDERPREATSDLDAAPTSDVEFVPEGESDEIGEGAPGADGGRRWRGRRGRRRGRGVRDEQTPGTSTGESEFAPAASSEDEFVVEGETRAPREERVREDRPAEVRSRDEGGDRGGRERGRRGGVRGRLDAIRERFAPRGDRHRKDEGETVDVEASSGPAVEPFILPGESLGKYRPRDEKDEARETAKSAEVTSAPKPSTEFKLTEAWDGGMVLPGETLRPREPRGDSSRNDSSSSDAPREARGPREDRGGREVRGGREERGGRGGRDRRRDRDRNRGVSGGGEAKTQRFEPRGLDPAEAVLPGVTAGHDLDEPIERLSDDAPAYEVFEHELGAQAETHHADVKEIVEFQETEHEYEPEENASASFRADAGTQREFRQSAPEEDLAEAAFEDVEEHEAAPVTAEEPQHEFTSVQSTGEMLSETPIEAAPQDNEHPAAPIEHEVAVQQVKMWQAEQTLLPPFDNISNPMAFAPGDGALEEELIDEEEADLPAIYASVGEEMEEETLEGAADLGTMLREMSIDDITRAESSHEDDEDDDFDIDEEDIEEDAFASDEEELSGSDVSEVEEDEFAEGAVSEGGEPRVAVEGESREPRRRRDGRRGGRDRDRGGRDRERSGERSSGDRERSGGDRERSSGGRDRRGMSGSRGRGRHSVQASELPAISDLLKPGQEVLVQIAKEPIAKKGARITSHIALPGRFLVFMPTVNHTGVSRKIESDGERRRLKEILLSEKGDASGGFIVRTAASGASEEELRSDLRFLLNLWADIKQRSESSKSPSLIYHDLNLIERILRDQVTDNFSAIWVDTEDAYERILRFLQRFQPSLIRRVKLYTKDTPLFEQFGITEEINKALRSKVWLKSGGSIVINQTEALVAIDINTGKYVGKTTKLEDTIVKTNLDAIPEIVRQIRLRDLGGIIIIDFIDMDERKNRNKVMQALEDELKKDRAPSKVLQFNDFGLVAITRKRVKQSLERTLSTTCTICAGTGMTKSPITVANEIYIEMRKMHKTLDKGDIMLRVHPEVVKQLKLNSGKWLHEMEELSGKTILVKSDPALHPEQFDIH